MVCTISLGPNDDLELITPAGRRVYIPVGPHSTQLLWQVLWNATAEKREINASDNSWVREELKRIREAERQALAQSAEAKAEERKRKQKRRFGFTLDNLEVKI